MARRYKNRTKPAPYKIEAGVPVHEWRRPRAKEEPGQRVAYPFHDMQPGDSFEAPLFDKDRIAIAARAHGRRNGRRFTTRRTGWNLCRCWRIE